MEAVDVDLNLLRDPPKDLYVECRVISDLGEVETESGTLLLKKGTKHHLQRKDAELLIRQGYLEHITY